MVIRTCAFVPPANPETLPLFPLRRVRILGQGCGGLSAGVAEGWSLWGAAGAGGVAMPCFVGTLRGRLKLLCELCRHIAGASGDAPLAVVRGPDLGSPGGCASSVTDADALVHDAVARHVAGSRHHTAPCTVFEIVASPGDSLPPPPLLAQIHHRRGLKEGREERKRAQGNGRKQPFAPRPSRGGEQTAARVRSLAPVCARFRLLASVRGDDAWRTLSQRAQPRAALDALAPLVAATSARRRLPQPYARRELPPFEVWESKLWDPRCTESALLRLGAALSSLPLSWL
eukprot:gene5540-16235_t